MWCTAYQVWRVKHGEEAREAGGGTGRMAATSCFRKMRRPSRVRFFSNCHQEQEPVMSPRHPTPATSEIKSSPDVALENASSQVTFPKPATLAYQPDCREHRQQPAGQAPSMRQQVMSPAGTRGHTSLCPRATRTTRHQPDTPHTPPTLHRLFANSSRPGGAIANFWRAHQPRRGSRARTTHQFGERLYMKPFEGRMTG